MKNKIKRRLAPAKTLTRKVTVPMPIAEIPLDGSYAAKGERISVSGTYKAGLRTGVWHFDEEGVITDRTYVDGIACDLDSHKGPRIVKADVETDNPDLVDGLPKVIYDDAKLMARIAKAFAKSTYGKWRALDLDGNISYEALFLRVWRTQHLDISHEDALELLAGAAPLINGGELLEMLKTIKLDEDHHWPLPWWSNEVDRLALAVYAHDPDPIDTVWTKLPARIQAGIAYVRARHGKDVGSALTKHAKAVTESGNRASSLWWPDTTSSLREIDCSEAQPPEVAQIRAMFGSDEVWCRGLERALKNPNYNPDIETHWLWIEHTPVKELARYVNEFRTDWVSVVKRRRDDAAALTTLVAAIEPDEDGLRDVKSQLAAQAIIAYHDEGKTAPDALLECLELRLTNPRYNKEDGVALGSDPELRLQQAHTKTKIEDIMSAELGNMHRALQTLPEPRVAALLAREAKEDPTSIAMFLYLVEDVALVDRVLDAFDAEKSQYTRDRLVPCVGLLGSRVIEALVARLGATKGKKNQKMYRIAIIAALARMMVDEGGFDERYDRYLELGLAPDDYLDLIICRLPRERAEKLLLEALESPATFVDAFERISACGTEAVFATAFTQLLTAPKLRMDKIEPAIDQLPDGPNWWAWLHAAGVTGKLRDECERRLGLGKYAD